MKNVESDRFRTTTSVSMVNPCLNVCALSLPIEIVYLKTFSFPWNGTGPELAMANRVTAPRSSTGRIIVVVVVIRRQVPPAAFLICDKCIPRFIAFWRL
jgi:hypothetical protein